MSDDAVNFTLELADFLNAEFGSDISKLQDAHRVLDRIKATEENLKSKLPPSTEDSSLFTSFDKTTENALLKLSRLQQRHKNLQLQATKQIEVMRPIKEDFTGYLNDMKQIEKTYNYLQWISYIEQTNDLMEEAVKEDVDSDMVQNFVSFKETWSKAKNSSCKNLVSYIENTMFYWHAILKEKFESEFQKVLTSLQWPVLFTNVSRSLKINLDVVAKFNYIFKILYQIQLPNDCKPQSEEKISVKGKTYLLPLQLMFDPLRKRFIYHFMSNKPTTKADKPEWYLTQILTWISDHASFMNDIVQPLLEEEGLDSVYAFEELMGFLVQLASNRLNKDLCTLMSDDILLSHTIDEIFLFERELVNQGYPGFYPSILEVLLTQPCFALWKALEHKSALDKMDRLLSSETAFKPCFQQEESDADELCVPECAEVFITLLLTMTERYQHLPEEKYQLCFMELQLELLDDFRLRLHQLSQYQVEETLDTKYCAIINAVNYVVIVLNEWSNFPLFLKLYACMQKQQAQSYEAAELNESKTNKLSRDISLDDEIVPASDDELDGSVFDEAIVLLEHMRNDLLNTLCERVMLDVKAKSRAYRKEKWFCMTATALEKKSLELSPLAYPLLDILNSSLQSLHDLLAKHLFTNVWQLIAKELDEYLYEEVILQNSFSERGAEQLNFDMSRNLFPIFGMYTVKPENYFKLVKESSILLTLSPAPALLLKELLKDDEKAEEQSSALAELGVYILQPSQALVILSQRNDLSI